jgi:glucose-1-phosphate thymidylyltransferase
MMVFDFIMKGVVLAGGQGTRLRPMTRVVNKHLLPVYDEPLIYYPVRTLVRSGINEILVISSAEYIGKYIELLEESDIEASFSYRVQSEPNGIAHAVKKAENFVEDEFAVVLGDNIITSDLSREFVEFQQADADAQIFLTEVTEPSAYGVAVVDGGDIVAIEEKPQNPKTDYAVIGAYAYTSDVFNKIDSLEPSDRGEYEITDVNNEYITEDNISYNIYDGEWFDAGTPEGLFQAAKHIRNQGGD